jgi:iron-sulfur cluster repair protein YtfE (RIC family)
MTMVTLGAVPTGEGLLDLLGACHARIRSHARLAFVLGARAELEVSSGAAQCLRYFREALPLHVRDEEESLVPRLAGREPAFDLALAQMHVEHREHEARLAELLALLERVQVAPHDLAVRRRLALIAGALETDLDAHLRNEEAVVFPAITQLLSGVQQREIVRELRTRRAA